MLGRRFLLIILTNLAGAATGVVTLFAIGRLVASEATGMFAYGLSIAGMAAFLSGFGFDQAHVKKLSEGKPIGTALATYARIKVLLVAAFVVLTATAAWAWARTRGFANDVTPAVLALAIAYFAFLQLRGIAANTFNGLLETGRSQAVVLTEHLIKLPALVLAALLVGVLTGRVHDRPRLEAFLASVGATPTTEWQALLVGLGHVLPMLGSLVVGLWLLADAKYRTGRFDKPLARDYARFAVPLGLFAVLQPLATQLDTVMIGFYNTSADVGYYYYAQRIVTFTLIIPTAVGTLYFPRMGELLAAGRHDEAHGFTLRTQQVLSLMIWLPSVLVVALARELLHLFGDEYLPAWPILIVLALNIAALSYGTISSNVLMAFGRPRVVASIGASMLAANAILNVVFIAPFLLDLAGLGAALATILAQLLGLGLTVYWNVRITGRVPFGPFVLRHLGAAAATLALLLYLKAAPLLGGLDRWYEVAFACALGTVAYILVLTLLGELGRREWGHLSDALHPWRLLRYAKDEVLQRGR